MDAVYTPPAGRAGRSAALVAAGLVVVVAPGRAGAELFSNHDGVREGGCDLTVTLDGPVARVAERHRLTGGDQPDLARYSFRLPPGALIDGFTVTPAGGRREAGAVVTADGLSSTVATLVDLPPDLGLLHRLDPDDTYQLQVFPVAARGVASFTIAWSVPMTYRGGRMILTAPARGDLDDPALSSCQVRVTARPGGGVTGWSQLYAMGAAAGRGGAVLVRPDRELVVEAVPSWAGVGPVLAARTADLGGGSTAMVAGIYVPDRAGDPRFAPRRLVVVVDTSRSLQPAGRRAAALLTDRVLEQAPAGIPIEVMLFDRDTRRVLGWPRNAGEARERAAAAVLAAPPASGTDLAGALAEVRDLIDDDGTRVVIITDGLLPTDQTGPELIGHLVRAEHPPGVDVIVPLVPGAVAPARGPLDQLAEAFHGRVLAVRSDQLPDGRTLLQHLRAGAALEEPRLRSAGTELELTGDLPATIEPGHGVVVTGAHPGRLPRLTMVGTRAGAAVDIAAVSLPAGAERFAVAAALTPDPIDSFALARRHHLVGPTAALAVIAGRDQAARLRRDLAARTGLFEHVAAPFEPELGAPLPASSPATPVIHVGRASGAGELPRGSVRLAIRQQLVPRLQVCYRELLRHTPTDAGNTPTGAGTLDVELEIARGEVMAVRFGGDPFPEELIRCAADAAYSLSTPVYALGDQPDAVYVVRKPVTFQRVAPGDGEAPPPGTAAARSRTPAAATDDHPAAAPVAPTRTAPRPAAGPAAGPIAVDPDAPL